MACEQRCGRARGHLRIESIVLDYRHLIGARIIVTWLTRGC